MAGIIRWSLVATLVGIIVVAPAVYFRCVYDTHKRLRVVQPGRFYRSGQMTADGFTDAVDRYHIRTIINVQDEFPDPVWRRVSGTARPSRKANCAGNSA